MKKKILSLALLLALTFIMLASCASNENVAAEGAAKIVVQEGENTYTVYEVDLAKLENRSEGVISLLEHIASQEGSTLYYNVQWGGGYGAYITSIGSINPNPAYEYIAIYTNERADFAVPNEYMPEVLTLDYDSTTLTYTGVGLSSMHVNDGTVILFCLHSFGGEPR